MARYIYEWKSTQHGHRLFRRPSAASLKAAAPKPDLASLKKDELIEVATEQGLDTSGTKADIIERLEADDDES